MVLAREASELSLGSSCPNLHATPASYLSQCFRSCFPYQQGKLRLHLLQVVAHGSACQQDAHFALQNDTGTVGGCLSQGGWGQRPRKRRGWFFPLQLSNTPYPPPDRLWIRCEPAGDSLCGVARMVTVQRQSRSVAWALGVKVSAMTLLEIT